MFFSIKLLKKTMSYQNILIYLYFIALQSISTTFQKFRLIKNNKV